MAYKSALIVCILLLSFPTKIEGGPICYASCLATIGVGGVIAGPAIISSLGFTAAGIKGGSWAAAWMASHAGFVPAGSIFAWLQSIGAVGGSWTSYGSVFKICTALCSAKAFTEWSDTNNINECYPDPCKNGGECVDEDNDYTCSCPVGYTGINCQIISGEEMPLVRRAPPHANEQKTDNAPKTETDWKAEYEKAEFYKLQKEIELIEEQRLQKELENELLRLQIKKQKYSS